MIFVAALLGLQGTNTGDPQNRSGGGGPISNDRILRQTVPLRPAERGIRLVGDGARRTVAARGSDVTVTGDRNDLRITGVAKVIRVVGRNNRLNIERAGRIEIKGDENLLLVTRAAEFRFDGRNNSALVRSSAPYRVVTKGVGNRVTRARKGRD